MSEKWTEGPWEFFEGEDNNVSLSDQDCVLGSIKGGKDFDLHICRVWNDINGDKDMIEERANANLIKTAPKLYAALKELCDSCMGECEDCQVSRILKEARGES